MMSLLVLVQPQTWIVYEYPYSYNPVYYSTQNYYFVLTENDSLRSFSFYTPGVIIRSIQTNNTPISLSFLSGDDLIDRFSDVTTVSQESLVLRGPYSVRIDFAREEADAIVNVSLGVGYFVTVTIPAPVVVVPIPLIGAALGGCLLAIYKLMRIETRCRMLLAAQSRWSLRRGLVLVILLITLTASMLAPHLGNAAGGAYRVVERLSIEGSPVPLTLTIANPVEHIDLTVVRQDGAVQDIGVLDFCTDREVAIELYQEDLLLLELHVSSDLNSSHFELPTQATELVIRRVSDDADVSFELSLTSVTMEPLDDPLPYMVLAAIAIAPFSCAVLIVRSVRLRLHRGAYAVDSESEIASRGPDVE